MKQFEKVGRNVGRMRHRIQLIALTKGVDPDYGGETTITDTVHATVWAERMERTVGSGEDLDAGQLDQVQAINWRIRYLSTVKTDMLVYADGLYYDILSVLPDNTNTYMILETKQRGENWDQTET